MIPIIIRAIYFDLLVFKCTLSKVNFIDFDGTLVSGIVKYKNNVRRNLWKRNANNIFAPESIYLKYGIFK